MRYDETKKKDIPNPSVEKSEVGAIERIELYGPADKRSFSDKEAVDWLANPITGSAYHVRLFDILYPRSQWDQIDPTYRRLVESFIQGIEFFGPGLSVKPTLHYADPAPTLSVRLDQSQSKTRMSKTPYPLIVTASTLHSLTGLQRKTMSFCLFPQEIPILRIPVLNGQINRSLLFPTL